MADLYDLAKANKVTEFEKEWASLQSPPVAWPFTNSTDRSNCSASFNYYKSLSGGGGGAPPPASNKTLSIPNIIEARSGQSKIADISPGDSIDALKLMDARLSAAEKNKMIQGEMLNQLKRESDLHTNISEKIGLSGDLLEIYVDRIAESQINALRFGYNMEQVSGMITSMSDANGKFNLLSEKTLNRTYETGRAFIGSLRELGVAMTEFEKVGIGAKNAMDAIDKSGRSSMSLGLNAKKTTEMLRNDIGKLNEFGFSGGVDGLSRMVQKSLEFRMNMSEVFKFADKVMDPDKAIELTANMQMLGGAVGDLNDPLKLMYMATNNVEGLQDALIGAAGELAVFNEEQGRFEITGLNLRRAKEMANQLGISYQELTKSAIASQERLVATNDLLSKGFDISDADREFIVNMSQMKDGKMTITVPDDVAKKLGTSTEVAIESLTEEQVKTLTSLKEDLRTKSVEEIARGQFDSVKNIENDLKSLTQRSIRDFGKKTIGKGGTFDVGKSLDTVFGDSLEILGKRQTAGDAGIFKTLLEPITKTIETALTDLDIKGKFEDMFKSLGDQLKAMSKSGDMTKYNEQESERRLRNEDNKPIAFNFKHDFNLVPRFDVPFNLEYKGSKEEYV